MAHIISNTEKVYACIFCGSRSANIVREASSLEATKVKCNQCSAVYTASDSKELEERGGLPDGLPDIPEAVHTGDIGRRDGVEIDARENDLPVSGDPIAPLKQSSLPKTPSFVFISKDRTTTEFCTKRELKRTVLAWTHLGTKFDVYELHPKKISAKIDIQ